MPKRQRPIVFQLNQEGEDLSLIQNQEAVQAEIEAEEPEELEPDSKVGKVSEDGEEAVEGDEPVQEPSQEVVPTEPTESEIVTKHKLITVIRLYIEWFPHKLQGFKELQLDEMDVPTLRQTLLDVRFIIKAQNISAFNHSLLMSASRATEALGGWFGLELDGLTRDIEEDADFNDLVKEIALDDAENGFSMISPWQRGLAKMASKITNRHFVNAQNSVTNKLGEVVLPDSFVQNYQTL